MATTLWIWTIFHECTATLGWEWLNIKAALSCCTNKTNTWCLNITYEWGEWHTNKLMTCKNDTGLIVRKCDHKTMKLREKLLICCGTPFIRVTFYKSYHTSEEEMSKHTGTVDSALAGLQLSGLISQSCAVFIPQRVNSLKKSWELDQFTQWQVNPTVFRKE